MSTDDVAGAAAARGHASEAPDEAWEAAPEAEPTPGARRRVEPDLLWIESVTERLLGTAGRPASWERAYFPSEPAARAPETAEPGPPVAEPVHHEGPAPQDHAQPDPAPPAEAVPAPETSSSPPVVEPAFTARDYVPPATVAPPAGDPLAAPRPPATAGYVPPPLPTRVRPSFEGPVSFGRVLAERTGSAPEPDPVATPFFAPQAAAVTVPADQTLAAPLAPTEPVAPAGEQVGSVEPHTAAASSPMAVPSPLDAASAAPRRREEDMPPSVLRAALRDALPDDLARRPRPVDAVFGDPSWSQPPEVELSDGEDGEDGAPPSFGGARLIDLDAPELAARAASTPPSPGPPTAPADAPAAVPAWEPAVTTTLASERMVAPPAAPTEPAPATTPEEAFEDASPRMRTSPRHASAPAAPSSGYPRTVEGLATTDVALRLALLSGDEDLAASVLELIRSADRDRLRLRLVEAYLDALLDGGGDALPGAARLRRLLGD